MKKSFALPLLLGILTLVPLAAMAQDNDPFEDDPFSAQQNSMRRQPSRNAGTWRPSTYSDQMAMLEAMAKAQIKRSLKYRFESVGTIGDGLHTPFWLSSNRQGLASATENSGYMRYGMFGEMLLPSGFGMKYGMDLGIGTGLQENWFVQQLYIDLGWKWLGMSMGMKERSDGLLNIDLSSGGLMYSGNCRPIPQIRIGSPEYVRLNILDNLFSLKGHVAYGIYTDGKWRGSDILAPYTDGILHHSKDVFLKIGDADRFPLELTMGVEAYSQFGGTMHNRCYDENGELLEEYQLPHNLKAFGRILASSADGSTEDGKTLGNCLLSLDAIFQTWTVRAYYEHPFVSGTHGGEFTDGMLGMELNLPSNWPVRDIVVEYMDSPGIYNSLRYDSYSLNGLAIGSPVFISPVCDDVSGGRFRDSRVRMLHFGIDGGIGNRFDYALKLTSSHHDATGISDGECDLLSAVASVCVLAGDDYSWKFGLSAGFDSDECNWLGDNKGLMLSITKMWKTL